MSLPFLYSICHHLKCNDLYYLLRFSISIIECVYMLSRVYLSVTPWTIAHQAPLSMGLSRQEYWSGLPFLSPGDLPDPGIESVSPALAGIFFTTEPPGKPELIFCYGEQDDITKLCLLEYMCSDFSNINAS